MYINHKRFFNFENIISVISVLALIILESNTYISIYKVSKQNSIRIMFAILLINVLYTNVYKQKKLNLNLKKMLVFLFMSILLMLNKVLTSDSSNFTFMLIILIAIAFIFSELFSLDKFINYFTNIMIFLCVYSLLATYLAISFPTIFSKLFPSIYHSIKNMYFLDMGLCFVYIPEHGMQFRNYSVFSEPGVFQFYILLSLILDIWYLKRIKYQNLRLVVYFVTLLSTFSTAGLIIGSLVYAYYLFFSSINTRELKMNLSIIFFIFITIFTVEYLVPGLFDLLKNSFSKLFGVSIGGSKYSRIGSLIAYFTAWLERPFFGWGYESGIRDIGEMFLSKYTIDNTNTIFTNLGLYGIFYGGVYLVLFCKFFISKLNTKLITRIVALIAMMLSINNERFIDSTLIFIIIFYSLNKIMEKQVYEKKYL